MAISYLLNKSSLTLTPQVYGAHLEMLVEMLIGAGWTYKASGDGAGNYNATGKVFTYSGPGSNGWGNGLAWARIADPGDGRELTFQMPSSANSGNLIIKYSAAAKFTGGTPAHNVVPTATDEKVLTETTASISTGGGFFPLTVTPFWGGNCVYMGAAMDTPPYGFWFAGQILGSGARYTSFMMDPVVGPAGDPDPVVFVVGGFSVQYAGIGWGENSFVSLGYPVHSNAVRDSNPGAGGGACAHLDPALDIFGQVRPMGYGAIARTTNPIALVGGHAESISWQPQTLDLNPFGLGPNPFNGKSEVLPVLWSRVQTSCTTTLTTAPASSWMSGAASPSTLSGHIKGWSTMLRWTGGVNRQSFVDTIDNKARICVGPFWLPWDGATTPHY